MPLPTARSATSPDRQWFIVGRWQQYYGEVQRKSAAGIGDCLILPS